MRRGNIFWGLFLVFLGVLFFLQARGIITNVFSFIFPLALILIGGWIILGVFWKPDLSDDDTFSFSLQSAKSVRYEFSHGAGQIQINGGAPAGKAIVGSSAVGMNTQSRMDGDRLTVEIGAGPSIIPFIGPSSGVWRYQITQEVPVTLEINAGASSLDVDLQDVLATRIECSTGASSVKLTMPARGVSLLDAEAGAASFNIRVPAGVAGRIRFEGGLNNIDVDTNRFPKVDSGFYQSPDFDSATNRAEINFEGGLGSVTVK
ncbi:MAG TPA: hypothetical protein PKK96_02600 [Anaerolineales bacterium]|nr:hypothetical protein [Anaerolineales bacterium]HNQ93705.1 hypothetical protein [Anaerolineales bacterium]HNS59869.1 hypothetical protein [Anaerolineales bacterium]